MVITDSSKSIQPYGYYNCVIRSASAICCAVFFKSLSYLTTLINLVKAQSVEEIVCENESIRKYELLSTYYWHKANAIDAYDLFGDDLIAPAINMECEDDIIRPLNPKKIDHLFAKLEKEPENFLCSNRKLYPSEKSTKGVCFSAALSFIAKFFKLKRAPLLDPQKVPKFEVDTAIKKLGLKFQNGVSEKVGMVQGINYVKTGDAKDFYLQSAIARMKFYDDGISFKEPNEFLQYGPGALGAIMLKSALEDDGVYLLIEEDKEGSHAIVYIKEEGREFLYDPNLGTISIPKNHNIDFDYFWKSSAYIGCNEGLKIYKAEDKNLERLNRNSSNEHKPTPYIQRD